MYTEIVGIKDIERLRKVVDEECKYFKDEDLTKILSVCSGMLDRAVVKCFLGMEQKAKEAKDGNEVNRIRILLHRFEAGLIQA